MKWAVQIDNVSFGYDAKMPPQIKELHLQIGCGKRFGIFGPNGAGKTTLMSLMTGLLQYNTGSVRIFDKELLPHQDTISQQIGFVPQDFSFYEDLSPAENMAFFGAWYGLSATAIKQKTTELLAVMGLSSVANKPVKQFSGGMKRRVNLALAVMHDPQLLFLDEPTVGVDVQSRNAIIQFLKSINTKGATLVYTSHQLKEAEDLCEDIALIDQGQIIANDSLKALLVAYNKPDLEALFLQLTGRAYRD